MADETRTVIIDVDVENKDFDQEIGDVNKELRKNKELIKELSKDYDKNSTEIAKLDSKNKDLSASKRDLDKQSKIESKSLNGLRLQLADQTKERNNLNKSTVDGAKRFKELQGSIKGLNDEIGGFEEAGGDFRRNVGDYPSQLGAASGGVKGFGTSLGSVFKMIAANPFALILGAVAALIAVFAKSQTGMEFFRKAGAALNIVLAKLSDVVEFLGASMIEAFENPQKALDDLVETIKNGIVKYFTEFIPNAIGKVLDAFGLLADAAIKLFQGDFAGALDTATEAAGKWVDGITDLIPATALLKKGFELAVPAIKAFGEELNIAVNAAARLEAQLIANEKAQADMNVRTAEAKTELLALKKLVDDTTKSEGLRIAAAELAAEIEEELLKERLRLQGELVQIIKDQNALANSTEEDIQRRRDAEIAFYAIQAESIARSASVQKKQNALQNAQRKKEEKDRKDDIARIKKEDAAKVKRDKKDLDDQDKQRVKEGDIKKQGLADLNSILGQETAAGKAAAIARIAIDSAIAVAGAVRGAMTLPFPASLAAIVTGIAAALSGISQAKSLLSGGAATFSAPSAGTVSNSALNSNALSGLGSGTLQSASSAAATSQAIENIPPPIVSVVDIVNQAAARATVVSESEL